MCGCASVAALPMMFEQNQTFERAGAVDEAAVRVDASPAMLFATAFIDPSDEQAEGTAPAQEEQRAASQNQPAAEQEQPASEPAPPVAEPAPADSQAPIANNQEQPAPATSGDDGIRFNFKGATFDQVLDFFSRATGLPIVREADVPAGTLDYLSPESYELPEALRILNILLQSRGVMLRQEDSMLYLQKLTEMQRENVPTYIGELPGEVSPEQIVTVVIPLRISMAGSMAEKLKTMVAEYGAVTAMEQQNALVITETAAQIRRLASIITELDREDPEGAIEIFAIQHARAVQLMEPLKALLSQKEVKYVINQQGQQVMLEENTMPGLAITADERTNSIIAKGLQQRIDKLREAIELLDVPATANARLVRSFALVTLTPGDAANRVNALFAKIPEEQRPVVIPLEHDSKVTLVGSEAPLAEAALLLKEIDGLGSEDGEASQPALSVLPLDHVRPDAAVNTLRALLNPRQANALKLLPGLDGKSIIVNGPSADVSAIVSLIPAIDTPPKQDRQVRLVRVTAPDAAAAVNRAQELHAAQADQDDPQGRVHVQFDAESRLATVLGTAEAVNRFLDALRQVEATVVIERQVQRYELAHALPSRIAPSLSRLAVNLTMPMDGRANVPPTFEAIDDLNVLLVTGTPEQLEVISPLVANLDEADAAESTELRIIPLEAADAMKLAPVFERQYASRTPQQRKEQPVSISADPGTNALLVVAHPEPLAQIESLAQEFETRAGESREQVRTFVLKHAKAESVAPLVTQLLAPEEIPIWIRYDAIARNRTLPDSGPEVRVAADHKTNAVVVTGPVAVLSLAEQIVASLDVDPAAAGGAAERDVRVFLIGNADAGQLSRSLRAIFAEQAQHEDPPVIEVDVPSNTLIARGTEAQLATIERVAKEVDDAAIVSSRQIRMIPIDPSKATAREIADTLERLLDQGKPGRVEVISIEELRKRREVEKKKEARGGALPLSRDPESAQGSASSAYIVPALQIVAIAALAQIPESAADSGEADITVAVDEATNSLVIIGSARAVDRAAGLASQIQDRLPAQPGAVHYITLDEGANATVVAALLNQTLLQLSAGQGATAINRRVGVLADQTNSAIILICSDADFTTVGEILAAITVATETDRLPLTVLELQAVRPEQAARLLTQLVISTDRSRKTNTLIVPSNETGRLLVRAPEDVIAEMREVLREIDRAPTTEFAVRTMVLERADAASVATAIQRFYDDRARIASVGRGRTEQGRRISIIGESATNTILIAASDEDFAEIQNLVTQFDTPEATSALTFRVFQLRHAKANQIEQTVQGLIEDLTWGQGPMFFWGGFFGGRQQQQRGRGTLAVRADERLNALIVTGEGDKFAIVEQMIDLLDAPPPEGEERIARLYHVRHMDVSAISGVIEDTYGSPGASRRWWEPASPTDVKVRADNRTKTIIVYAAAKQHDEIAQLIQSIDQQVAPDAQTITVLSVDYAQAADVARTLTDFMRSQARATGAAAPAATITASPSANRIIVAAPETELALIRDLVSKLDRSDVTDDRTIEIVPLTQGDSQEIARIVGQHFRGQGGQGVIITPDARTNSLIVNAPRQEFGAVEALIAQLDGPSAGDETIIRTYTLDAARAEEAVRILSQTLQLDARGRTTGTIVKLEDENAKPVEVKARIVADRRSNSIVVTATEQSFPIIESLIEKLEQVPAASPLEYRIITLEHALASDVSFTLRQFTRTWRDGDIAPSIDYNRVENQIIVAATADQIADINRILEELDQPSSSERITDFVPLRFAKAEQVQEALSMFFGPYAVEADTPGKRNVRIVADPATNSLVISAGEAEWESVRALLAKLDSEDYDASLQLKIMPLTYADAASVARAINEAFAGELERARQNAAERQPPRRTPAGAQSEQQPEVAAPAVLIQAEQWVRASAETHTNSIIVSASRQNMQKIEHIVEQLDVADYASLPPPQLIPVRAGDPVQLAASLTAMYQTTNAGPQGRRSVRIVGDATSNTIIVRAEEDDFAQIQALAHALQQEASTQGLAVHVIPVKSMPAARVASSITQAFQATATQLKQPLSIQVDPQGNSLIVACTGSLIEPIRATVAQLEAMWPAAPGSGTAPGIFIIELENIEPSEAQRIIETIGLDKPQPADAATRLLVEPIKVGVLPGRKALIIVGSPADRDTIVALLKSIDTEPHLAEAQVRIVRLRNAQAQPMVTLVQNMLGTPASGRSGNAPGATPAAEELIRRLSVRRDGAPGGALFDASDVEVDLTEPIRLVADAALNAVIVSSSEQNANAIVQVIELLDQLPITSAVTVQIFPLQNIAATQFARIVKDLFAQGKNLASVPGTTIKGVPDSNVGRALLDEVAMAVDERTNTIVVAGKEDAVALVEVLSKRLDSDISTGWVEPRILPLRYADATSLAETLQRVVVDGLTNLPESVPLRETIGRLRIARQNGGAPGSAPDGVVESTIFQPITRLVLRAEPQLNAIIVVSTPDNIELIGELVKMLDVEAASPSAVVRIYPVKFASATRLAGTVSQLFDQQAQTKAIRPEDRVIVQPDERTNSLIVTTSPRSFTVLEELLKVLDAEIAPELREIRVLQVKNASALRLAEMVQRLMDQRLERLRQVQPDTADLERVAIVADARTNSLLIAAGNEAFEVIRRLVSDLDDSTLSDQSMVHVIPVTRSSVDRLATAVQQIMDRRYADLPQEISRTQKPLILTDARTNSLLIAANPEDIEAITRLVAQLEEAPINPAVGIHVITLQTGRAELLAPRLQQLMAERQQSLGAAGTPTDRVSIQADIATNSLIVAASEDNLQVVKNLIEALASAEGEITPGGAMEIVQLSSSRAADMVAMLDDLYVDEVNRTRGANTVRVRADDRLNAVVVHAPPGDVQAIKRMIAQLDGTRPSQVVEIKYIPLASANALETVSLIENVLSGRGIDGRRTGQQATVLKYLREIAKEQKGIEGEGEAEVPQAAGDEELTEMEVSAAIRQSITLTPDMRTNTVIVSAPSISMPMIEQMIRDLDTTSIGAQNIRIFKLVNADAIAMAEILTQLFNLSQRGNLYVLKPREGVDAASPGGVDVPALPDGMVSPGPSMAAGLSGTELTAVPDERQQLSITVDSRTNSLLVSGTPTYLDLVERVVKELDQQEANERETYLYQLRNSSAAEVATVLSSFVELEQRKLIETLNVDQIGSAARLLEREVTIVGDPKSNSVLVSASPRYLERVKQMIEELDVDPPQVLIQVLLAEVTIDRDDEFGVNMAVRFDVDDAIVRGRHSLASLFGTAGMGVPTLAITASDFRLIIRAMEAQGRLQVLSNPTIMAVNNVPARIQVGETIRLPESTSFDQGAQQSSVVPEDIGVILEVTPSINPDGYVRMEINPEISELSARTTRISENFESPIVTRRRASTTVTVKDGQTVIIGGLISDRYERRDQKVPILGDFPIVGALFRSQQLSTAKTELLIVLTPHVVVSPAEVGRIEAQRLTDQEIDRLSLPDEIKDQIRRGYFDPTTVRQLAEEMYEQDKEAKPDGSVDENKESGDASSDDPDAAEEAVGSGAKTTEPVQGSE
jgi:type II secretion system protein D